MLEKSFARARIDPLTAGAIGVIAYLVQDFSHEALGHGGMCVALGGHVAAVTSTYLQCSLEDGWQAQAVTAAGSVLNLIAAIVAFAVFARIQDRAAPWTAYFFWLLGTLGFLVAGGYLMVSPLAGFGDWFVFANRTAYPLPWKLALTGMGIAIGLGGAMLAGKAISPALGVTSEERHMRIRVLTWSPYLAGCIVGTFAGMLNPLGWEVVFISAIAASFFGSCWLVFLVPPFAEKRRDGAAVQVWPRSFPWIAAGGVATLFTFVFGRGFSF